MLNKKLTLGFTIIAVLVPVVFSGCSSNKTTTSNKSIPAQTQKSSDTSATKDATITKPEADNSLSATDTTSQFKYDITSLPDQTQIKFNTPWETSPLGNFDATIEGKGEKAKDEGYSNIIVKDKKTGKLTKLTLESQEKNQITAKDLEWIDESEMFVIIGPAMGTVSMGGEIYKVNVKTGETSLHNATTSKEEYTAVHKTASGYTFEKYVYDDDNFTKGHTENGILK